MCAKDYLRSVSELNICSHGYCSENKILELHSHNVFVSLKERKRKEKNTLVTHSLASSLIPSAFRRIKKPVRISLMAILILNRVAVTLCLGK